MALATALIIAIAGVIVYAFSSSAKVQAVSLHCFWVGLLVFLLRWTGTLHFP
jgi:hypothetical protein